MVWGQCLIKKTHHGNCVVEPLKAVWLTWGYLCVVRQLPATRDHRTLLFYDQHSGYHCNNQQNMEKKTWKNQPGNHTGHCVHHFKVCRQREKALPDPGRHEYAIIKCCTCTQYRAMATSEFWAAAPPIGLCPSKAQLWTNSTTKDRRNRKGWHWALFVGKRSVQYRSSITLLSDINLNSDKHSIKIAFYLKTFRKQSAFSQNLRMTRGASSFQR